MQFNAAEFKTFQNCHHVLIQNILKCHKVSQGLTKCDKVSQSVTKFTKHSFRDGGGGWWWVVVSGNQF